MNSILYFLQNNFTLITAIATVIIAIATVINIFIYVKTGKIMQETNKLSRRQMTFANRPVLIVNSIPGSTDAKPISTLRLRITNHGNGPAFNIKGQIKHEDKPEIKTSFEVKSISKDNSEEVKDIKIPFYKEGSIANEWKKTLITNIEYTDVFGEKCYTIYHNGELIFKDSKS